MTALKVAMSACVVGLLVSTPATGLAQSAATKNVTPEVFGSVAWGHVANCCQVFGDRPNVGGGIGVRWRRLGVEFETNWTLGLEPRQAACGVPGGCIGVGHDGPTSAAIASANVLFFFLAGRVEPYVTGGVGALWSKQVSSTLSGRPPVFQDDEWRDHGFAYNFGGGFRFPVTASMSLRPEVRIYDATLLSRANLGVLRVGIQVGYRL